MTTTVLPWSASSCSTSKSLATSWEVQTRGRFVENIERAAGGPARQLLRQLHALRLAARQRRRLLPDLDVVEADAFQGFQLVAHARHGLEELRAFLDRHVEDVGDGLALELDLKRLAVVALALALVAGDVDVGQEMHLDLDQPVALAGLAAPTLDVERETPGLVAARPRLGQLGKPLADGREGPGVGRGIGARRAPDRALVDVDDLVEIFDALDALMLRRMLARARELAGDTLVERLDQQGRLAAAGDAGDAGEGRQRNLAGHVLQVVALGADDGDLARIGDLPPVGRQGDLHHARQILPRQAVGVAHDLLRRAFGHHFSAVDAGARPHVDDVIGVQDRILVMLDDDHRVAEVAQMFERFQQPCIVALVQTD